MKKQHPFIFFLLVLFLVLVSAGYAQDQSPVQIRIETHDGNVFTGTLISEEGNQIVIRTSSLGDVTILRSNIKHLTIIEEGQIRNGKFWFPNPHSTRYLFAPNAFGIPKGEGYYQNVWIFFNNVNYGVTNNFSMGAGIVPMFLFGVSETPIWLLPKVSIPVSGEKFHLAAGAMIGGVVGVGSSFGGLFYGMGTYGDRDRNMSVGLGYALADGEISSSPVLTVAGMYRATDKIYYLTENYLFINSGGYGIASIGIRWAPENFAVDFSLMRPFGEDMGGGFIGIPWLGVTLPFGR